MLHRVMDLLQTGIFALAERRLGWIDRRQAVLAQNIANADTPQYQPRDLPSFATTLGGATAAIAAAQVMTRTSPGHLAGAHADGAAADAQRTADTGAQGADGNGVALDEELTRVADTQNQQALTANLYSKYLGLFRLAMGRN